MSLFELCKNLTIELHRLMMQDPEEKCAAIQKAADDIRDQSDGPWYQLTEEEQQAIREFSGELYKKEEIEMKAVKGRFGWHPCDYETYLKLKVIKKRFWETVYAAARYERWHNKFPHNRKGKEPEKYCPLIGNRVWGWLPKDEFGYKKYGKIPSNMDQKLLDLFEQARRPLATEAEVTPFASSQMAIINDMFQKVESWFAENQKAA